MKKFLKTNGYIQVLSEESDNKSYKDYKYEHIIVAEEMLGRELHYNEVVHHQDRNRTNNSPDNLLVMLNSQHTKLHSWLYKNDIIPSMEYKQRVEMGCIRCAECDKPVSPNQKYCSEDCLAIGKQKSHKYAHPSKEELSLLVWSMPTTKIATMFGVSDKAIEKLCTKLGVEKPPRGYWAKVKAGKVKPR